MSIASTLKHRSFELQFWGYETGNVVAAITGAGGLAVMLASLRAATDQGGEGFGAMLLVYPDAFATLGILAVVLLGTPVVGLLRRAGAPRAADLTCALTAGLAVAVLLFVLAADAGWLTLSAAAFVLGSCMLRNAGSYPLLLKLGGLGIAAGGVALTGAAVSMLAGDLAAVLDQPIGAATLFAGVYVTIAGLLTYRGGCFLSAAADPLCPNASGLERLLHPGGSVARAVAVTLDKPLTALTAVLAIPALFWIPAHVIAEKPFLTSMLARLPWRVVTASLCLFSGTAAGISFAIANLLWAIGDLAIGALDFDPETVVSRRSTPAA